MFELFLGKLRKYEIRMRKAVTSERHGNFHSVFKGSGLEYDDLRLYQYGDDVRAIDWNTSAKGHGTFIKIFKEDKEQTAFFMLDVSASQQVGEASKLKIDIAKEICGVLTLSAIQEASRVGLLCFSDRNERYVRPSDGMKHGYSVLSEIYKLVPESTKTSISEAILVALNVLKRRSLIFLISDFIDSNYQHNLKALARKHDLIVIHLYDSRETSLPRLGIIPLYDAEKQRTTWVNTSSKQYRDDMANRFQSRSVELEKLCHQNRADYISINTQEDYVPALIRLFKVRRYAKSGMTSS
ncbi:Protein of unknown function DUF58 [Dyadobacter koreensis]|jgi:uncharacterized protein (DUF58 family)|uniref:DUF58 domain-containing protein n=1 Tax=Dyadobacter koreensis TaxID=408657 RepID=A0A1H6VYL8_9BACT|nr:DUF58 domain-containing protein [Dyadobacter koreensis]SEJ09771.1 Protein of unknown function DUF58 [Dyadobacter koreensis]